MSPAPGGRIPGDRRQAPGRLRTALLTNLSWPLPSSSCTDHREQQHFASMYIYIHIEKPTYYIHMHLYLYLYIRGVWKMGGKSSPLPGLGKLRQKQRAGKTIAFLFFTSKDIGRSEKKNQSSEAGGGREETNVSLSPVPFVTSPHRWKVCSSPPSRRRGQLAWIWRETPTPAGVRARGTEVWATP